MRLRSLCLWLLTVSAAVLWSHHTQRRALLAQSDDYSLRLSECIEAELTRRDSGSAILKCQEHVSR